MFFGTSRQFPLSHHWEWSFVSGVGSFELKRGVLITVAIDFQSLPLATAPPSHTHHSYMRTVDESSWQLHVRFMKGAN
jgi:hypothetical protein